MSISRDLGFEKLEGIYQLEHQIRQSLKLQAEEILPLPNSPKGVAFQIHSENRDLVVKWHDEGTQPHLELALAKHLSLAGVRACVPHDIIPVNRGFLSVFPFIEASTASDLPFSHELIRSLGRTSAQVHIALNEPRIPFDKRVEPDVRLSTPYGKLDPSRLRGVVQFARLDSVLTNRLIEYADVLEETMQAIGPSVDSCQLPHQWVHGDLDLRNVLTTSPQWTILDLENAYFGCPADDLAITITHSCDFPELPEKGNDSRTSTLLQGYVEAGGNQRIADAAYSHAVQRLLNPSWAFATLATRQIGRFSFLDKDINKVRQLAQCHKI